MGEDLNSVGHPENGEPVAVGRIIDQRIGAYLHPDQKSSASASDRSASVVAPQCTSSIWCARERNGDALPGNRTGRITGQVNGPRLKPGILTDLCAETLKTDACHTPPTGFIQKSRC